MIGQAKPPDDRVVTLRTFFQHQDVKERRANDGFSVVSAMNTLITGHDKVLVGHFDNFRTEI
jgi:hypothetical protein